METQLPEHAPQSFNPPQSSTSTTNAASQRSIGRIIAPRPAVSIAGRNPNDVLVEAQHLLQNGNYIASLDLLDEVSAQFPEFATDVLATVYDIYMSHPEKDSRYWLYQSRHYDFNIKSGEKVLDIGSGNIPFPFATHLGDISVTDHSYGRAGAPFKHIDGKPVYECNIEKLPFADNEFDFVYCSHVLEHVHNPERACSELMRVAKRGYIETPTRGKDLFLNTAEISNHTWKVELFDGRLVFSQYTPEELKGLRCSLLLDMHVSPQTDREKAFAALVLLKSQVVNTMLMWEGSFEVEVRRLTHRG